MPKSNNSLFFVVTTLMVFCAGISGASSLSIENDYRVRGILFTNNDFDNATSTDTLSYYSQRLNLTLKGKFNEGVEICTRISAIGVVGSTTPFMGIVSSTNTAAYPSYPSTSFVPYINYAYVKINNAGNTPLNIVAGKQPLSYGSGLIVDDNGIGMMAMRFYGKYVIPIPIPKFRFKRSSGPFFDYFDFPIETEIFTATPQDSLRPGYDRDIYGLVNRIDRDKYHMEFSIFQESDGSGSNYIKGSDSYSTNSINKYFYDIFIERREAISIVKFELAIEKGTVKDINGEKISLDGLGYTVFGELIGENTKLGKVSAHAQLAFFTGDKNPTMYSDDGSFNPTYTKRYDGLERFGYGELFAASPYDAQFPLPIGSYFSGIDTLNLGIDFSPLYGWNLGVNYYYFSSTEGPTGAPAASGFERLYGAQYALGVEMDLYVKFTHSKYTETRFSYCRYTPPTHIGFWPKNEPATRYQLEMSAKF